MGAATGRPEIAYAESGVHDRKIENKDLEVAFKQLEAFIFDEM